MSAAAPAALDASPKAKAIQTYAYAALVGAVAADAVLVGFGPVKLLGVTLPAGAALAFLVVALLAGVAAVAKRSLALLGVAVAALLLPALAERAWEMTAFRFVGSVVFGFLVLAYGELVHMTLRYEKWRSAAERTRTSLEGLDNATDEYLRTLARVTGLAAGVAGLVGALYLALLTFGPAEHRASLDFRSFYGLIGAAVLVFGGVGLYALARGGDFSRPRPPEKPVEPTLDGQIVVPAHSQVVAQDGLE